MLYRASHLRQIAEDALAGEQGGLGGVKALASEGFSEGRRRQVSAHEDWAWELQVPRNTCHQPDKCNLGCTSGDLCSAFVKALH